MINEVADSTLRLIFPGESEMARLCRAKNWSATPLGPAREWPLSLKSHVRTVISSRFPMSLSWGPDLILIYNDAYRASLRTGFRHPYALGSKCSECWVDIWDVVGPKIQRVLAGGESTWAEDSPVLVERDGSVEELYWTSSFSPAYDDDGKVGGVLLVCLETTARVLMEAEVQQSADHLENILESIHDAFFSLDARWRFSFVNSEAERVLRRKRADLIGRTIWEAFPEALGSEFEARYRRAVAEKSPERFEAFYPPLNSWYAVSAYPSPEGLTVYFQDVSLRHELEEQLRQKEHLLAFAGKTARLGGWRFDVGSPHVYWSDEVCAIHEVPAGTSPTLEEAINYYSPQSRPIITRYFERCLTDGLSFDLDLDIISAKGHPVWVRAIGEVVHDGNGVVVAVQGAFQDSTARKAAEVALAESEARLRQILDALPLGVMLTDTNGEALWRNPAEKRIWEGVKSGPSSAAMELLKRAASPSAGSLHPTGIISPEIFTLDTVQGDERIVRVATAPLRNETGAVAGAVSVTEDITQSRKEEARHRLLSAALEGLKEGICLMRPDGELLYGNGIFRDIFGIDPLAPTRRFPWEVSGPESQQERERPLESALTDGRWAGRVRRKRASDGVEILIDIVLGRVDGDGGAPLLFGISQDVTREVEKELHLRRVERLASVGTLVAGVAHELNNPLHAIRNFADLMLMETRNGDDAEALHFIVREADRAAKVVSDLRTLVRETQDAGEKTFDSADINDVVRHALRVRRYSLSTSNVDVRAELAESLPAVSGRRSELEQVMLNLIVNAEQAMQGQPGEKRLIVRTRATADGVSIQIIDSGPGIPHENVERIFDPFFTTKGPGEGTGLGLSLIHKIIAEHEGQLHVDSEPGRGAAFRIDLPRGEAPPGPARPSEAISESPLRILFVDDEESIRVAGSRYLRSVGHDVDIASDGKEALRLLATGIYDVVVSDLRMPGLGGDELFRRTREKTGASPPRFIFVTGDAALPEAVAAGFEPDVQVLLKPLKMETLKRAIESGHVLNESGRDASKLRGN